MRFRLGDAQMEEDIAAGKIDPTYADGADAFGGTKKKKHHDQTIASVSWCVDECASFYDNTNFTMQWCLISESLRDFHYTARKLTVTEEYGEVKTHRFIVQLVSAP